MKHLFCSLALACALVCYAQRVRENVLWLTTPLGAILVSLPAFLGLILSLILHDWFTKLGWLP